MEGLLSITGDVEKDKVSMQQFLEKNLQTFTFPQFHGNGEGRKIWCALFTQINNISCSSIHQLYLSVLRILSRDKLYLNDAICTEGIETLLKLSGLNQSSITDNTKDACLLESLKCLCNLVFNSTVAQTYCSRSSAVDGLFLRLRTYGDPNMPNEVKYFYMKLLFIITALCAEVRPKILSDCHGLIYLIEALDLILKDATHVDNPTVKLADDQVMLACEILKILFNLLIQISAINDPEDENQSHYQRLVAILHDLLLCETSTPSKANELQTQTVNLLTSVPNYCYRELLTPMVENCLQNQKDIEYKGKNMSAVCVLLSYLTNKLENIQNVQQLHEQLSPILTVLLKAVHADPTIRKFLKCNILPPLTDVSNRPETGNSIRNHLCRLLTTPITGVRDLVAELLFVLCKENVARMIKYTGYGNAAGLFANRGLLAGQNELQHQYSSDSDSDTDEYLAAASKINPVTGRCEPIQVDPTAHMSQEQKEHEAMELVKLIDQLSRGGIVKPCRIGTDGKPEPVEHILQLQEDLPAKNSDFYKK